MTYLKVEFGDNDFGGYVEEALKRIWRAVHTDNGYFIGRGLSSYEEVFKAFHKEKMLIPMIKRSFQAEMLYGPAIRHLNVLNGRDIEIHSWQKADIIKEVTPKDYEISWSIEFKVSFKKDLAHTKKWNNGEAATLVLDTGEVILF